MLKPSYSAKSSCSFTFCWIKAIIISLLVTLIVLSIWSIYHSKALDSNKVSDTFIVMPELKLMHFIIKLPLMERHEETKTTKYGNDECGTNELLNSISKALFTMQCLWFLLSVNKYNQRDAMCWLLRSTILMKYFIKITCVCTKLFFIYYKENSNVESNISLKAILCSFFL